MLHHDHSQAPGVADTVDMRHIKGHYYQSHRTINPTGIAAAGAGPSWT
jgi:glutathionyl-hydroquinone reductase